MIDRNNYNIEYNKIMKILIYILTMIRMKIVLNLLKISIHLKKIKLEINNKLMVNDGKLI